MPKKTVEKLTKTCQTAKDKSRENDTYTKPQKGGGSSSNKAEHDTNPGRNNMYNPFSRCGTEWLDSSQIQLSSLYLLHTQHVNATHQNIWGITYAMATNTHFIHQLRLAGRNNDLKDTVDIAQLLRDTFDREGPCPAIAIGDNIHFRTVLINSKTKSISLVEPFGNNFSEYVKNSMLDFHSKDNTGDWSSTEWKIKLQHDSYSCEIWAIWMQEKWRFFFHGCNTGCISSMLCPLKHDLNKMYKTYQLQHVSESTTTYKWQMPW